MGDKFFRNAIKGNYSTGGINRGNTVGSTILAFGSAEACESCLKRSPIETDIGDERYCAYFAKINCNFSNASAPVSTVSA